MTSAPELWSLLGQAEEMPYGSAQIALVEQVLRRVDEAGDPGLAFSARLFATTAYVYGGEPGKAFVPFSWCVADFDRNPAPYHQRWQHNLLWLFKAMVSALTSFPEVPLARTYAVLDDMERRYRESGHGMHAVYKHRYVVAAHIGQTEEADAWFERWQSAPRDSLSDCVGCDPTDVAKYLSSRGRYADAVALAEPVLSGDLSCTEQPQGILRELTVPYLLTGETQKAADAHRRAYRLERGNLADLRNIGSHLGFAARTGNEHRGLEILQRHIDWLEKAPSPAAEMNFAADAAMLLRRLTESGHGDLTVSRKDRADITVAALATELAERATAVAAKFDARNGTGHQGELIAEKIKAQPYETDVSLSPTARSARPETSTPEPAPEVPAVADPAELLDLATEQFEQERVPALAATLAALDERFPELADPLLAARRLAMIGNLASWRGDDTFVETWADAADLFSAAGAEGEAIVLRARTAVARAQQGEPGQGPAIQADIDQQESTGGPRERANAWARLAVLHAVSGELPKAIEAITRCTTWAAESAIPRTIASHAELQARILGNSGDREGAAVAARVAWEFYREHGPRFRLASSAALYGQLVDDPAVQIDAFGSAIAAGDAGEVLPARIGRGRALKQVGRPVDAVDDLVEAVALCAELDLVAGGAHARWELAEAYAMAERPVEAAEVAEEALIVFDELDDQESGNNARFLLAKQYREIGDMAGAVERYRELIERLADNPDGRGQVGEEAAGLLFDLDRDAEAAEAFRAAGEDLHGAGDLIGELRTLRRRISALHFADDPEAATETFQLAGERFAALPEELAAEPNAIWQNGMTAFEQSRVLMSRERYSEAVPILLGVPPRLRAIGAVDDADHLDGMYAEALLRSGDPAAAEAHLRDLLAGMAPDASGRELAEKIYQEAQDAKS
ncbi:tetratricopeptide (TPR) repeat protein [Actinoplanes tereljensis]|uniref:Tetratricopeptide repeat protein n=1 Tax=Paractinoplanes tereljensis TaxID=571912 RepID=A0A919NTH8_9ACTN|nr:tetratricopeptide repeat protein [Actinoplanes tereljensis]GIF24909.1 hypothetical protein Ate02nite_76390 [Actinoplanes tereljensis]